MSKHKQKLTSGGQLLIIAMLMSMGYLIGVTSRDATVQADVRRSPPEHQHFQSGAQRSEVLLQQISTTLDKMDGRLDRIEKLAARIAAESARPGAGEIR